jgi:hypothetical protein
MKSLWRSLLRTVGALSLCGASGLLSCGPGSVQFGSPCDTGADCASSYCVGGEAGGESHEPFCSEECTGRKTGDSCGGGRGVCVVDFVAWCWAVCESDDDCRAMNEDRAICDTLDYGGAQTQVCFAGSR